MEATSGKTNELGVPIIASWSIEANNVRANFNVEKLEDDSLLYYVVMPGCPIKIAPGTYENLVGLKFAAKWRVGLHAN